MFLPKFSARRIALSCACLAAMLMPLLLAGSAIHGQETEPRQHPWDAAPLSAEPRSLLRHLATLPPPKNPDVDILFVEHHIRYDEQGRTTTRYRHVFRVLSRAAVEAFGNTESSWAPWHQERPAVQARVITPDGMPHMLDPDTAVEVAFDSGDGLVFTNRRRLRAPLPGMEAGSLVEEIWELRDIKPLFPEGTLISALHYGIAPIRQWRLVVEYPEALVLRASVVGDSLEPTRVQREGVIRLTYEKQDLAPNEASELLLPPELPRGTQILLTTGKSWREIAAGYARLVDAQINTKDVEPLVKAALQGKESREEKIGKLLAVVRKNVRYTSLSFGESALAPANCLATITRRYGDCKDQSTLLVAMLRAAGEKACVALVNSGGFEDVPLAVPAVNHFNHAIVYLPGENPLWIDPTAGFSRAGELPLGCQGKLALICEPTTRELTRTPRALSAANRTISRLEITVGDREPGRGRLVREYSGCQELNLRFAHAQGTAESRRSASQEYVVATYGNAAVEKFEISEPDDLSGPFRMELVFAPVESFQTDLETWSYAINPMEVFNDLPLAVLLGQPAGETAVAAEKVQHGPRQHALVLPLGYQYETSYRVLLPAGFVVKQMPTSERFQLGPALVSWTTVREAEAVTVVIKFHSGPVRWSPQDVAEFRTAFASLTEAQPKRKWPLIVESEHQAASLLRAHKYREALALVQAEAKQSPESFAAISRLQRVLAQAGLVEPAMEAARQALEKHPDLWDSWFHAGQLFKQDVLGHERTSGSNITEATRALRKAVELAPDRAIARLALAEVLETDEAGRRFGDRSRLEEAAALYRELGDDPQFGQVTLVRRLVINLVLDRLDEVQGDMGKIIDEQQRWEWDLLATAAREGAAAAGRRAAEIQNAPLRAQSLARAAADLEFVRRYDLAADLCELAANEGRNADFANEARRLRQLKTYDLAAIPAHDPRWVVQEILARSISSGLARKDLAPLLHGDLSRFERSITESQIQLLDTLRAALQTRGISAAIQDRLALAEYRVDGSDAVGYRIRVDFLGTRTNWFVMRRPEGYRVMLIRDVAELGEQAMARLDAGDQDGARQWLDWAAENFARGTNIFDAYSAPPFTKLWSAAQRDSADDMRLAASVLAAPLPSAPAIKLLEGALEKETSSIKKLQLQRALASAFLGAKRPQDAEAIIDPFLTSPRTNAEWVARKAMCCQMQNKPAAIGKLLADQLARRGAPAALAAELLAFDLGVCGQYAEALAAFEQIEKRGELTDLGRLSRARIAAFLPSVPPEFVQELEAMVLKSLVGNADAHHVLSILYAHQGKPDKAMQALHRSVLARVDKRLQSEDWYVVGRVAEIYGLSDYARRCYERVVPRDDNQFEPSVLAQRRLKELAGK